MPTVTAIPEPDDVENKAQKVLRYAYSKRIEAEEKGRFVRAAFWIGFRRSFARRWYRH